MPEMATEFDGEFTGEPVEEDADIVDYLLVLRRENPAENFDWMYPALAYVREVESIEYLPREVQRRRIKGMLQQHDLRLKPKYELRRFEYIRARPNVRTGVGQEKQMRPAHFEGEIEIPAEVLDRRHGGRDD